jgi:succinate dehydrogenase subunit D
MSATIQQPRTIGHRSDLFWIAAMVHRISGVLLACFLPLHFLVLGLAIEHAASLDRFLKWTEEPGVRLIETALVFVLAVHLLGGIRVLLIENLTWRPGQKQIATAVIGIAGAVAMLFLLLTL